MKITMDRAAFKKWLEEKGPETTCGWTKRCHSCPVACWITSMFPGAVVSVCYGNFYINGVCHETPSWVNGVITGVDAASQFSGTAITRDEALNVLEGVPQ